MTLKENGSLVVAIYNEFDRKSFKIDTRAVVVNNDLTNRVKIITLIQTVFPLRLWICRKW